MTDIIAPFCPFSTLTFALVTVTPTLTTHSYSEYLMKKSTPSLPVSTKFLARIEQRIADVLTAIGSFTPDIHTLAMSYVHAYLAGGELPAPSGIAEQQCHLIVLTLRAEIDAAILRSQRARSRRRPRVSDAPAETPSIAAANAETASPERPAGHTINNINPDTDIDIVKTTPQSALGIKSVPTHPAKKSPHPKMFHPNRNPRVAPAGRGRFGLKIVHTDRSRRGRR